MYESVYPKLRAIYSFLPEEEDIQSLVKARGLSGFESKLKKMDLTERFPLKSSNIQEYITSLPFKLAKIVKKHISEKTSEFFNAYMKIYELNDIKSALHGDGGNYILFTRTEKPSMEDIDGTLSEGFWSEPWNNSYPRYKETENISDLEIPLDHHYYLNLLDSCKKLPSSDREDTEELILKWINLLNQHWIYRLRNHYELEPFIIKKFLIPEGNVFNNLEKTEGITLTEMHSKLSETLYNDFKMKMFTMRSIIAFFMILETKTNKLLSIYHAKILNLKEDRIKEITGI